MTNPCRRCPPSSPTSSPSRRGRCPPKASATTNASASSMDELQAFYDAAFPRLEDSHRIPRAVRDRRVGRRRQASAVAVLRARHRVVPRRGVASAARARQRRRRVSTRSSSLRSEGYEAATSWRKTSPPFITNPTCSVARDVGDVGSPGDADHVGEQTGREAASVIDADQLGGDDGRGADRLQWRHAAVDERDQLLRVPAVGDRGGVGTARDPHAAFDRLADRRPGTREHLRRLGLQRRRGMGDIHAVGEIGGRHQEGPAFDDELERLVAGERAVLDAIEAGLDRGPDAVVTVGVRRDLEPGAVRFVGDRRAAPRRNTAARRPDRCAT